MGTIDSVITLATEFSTKAVSEQVIRLDRLIISIDKIIRSFNPNATNPSPPQMVHLQSIEDIFYRDPQLFDEELMNKFFDVKNDLDSGAKTLPLSSSEYESVFIDIRNKVIKKRNRLKFFSKILKYTIMFLLALLLIWSLIVVAAIGKSKWNELLASSTVVVNPTSPMTKNGLLDSVKKSKKIQSESSFEQNVHK